MKTLFTLITCLAWAGIATGQPILKDITIPLRFHVIHGLEMEKRGQIMDVWITKQEIEESVLPELNLIWKSTGIQFEIEAVLDGKSTNSSNKEEYLNYISNAKRDAKGKADPKRIRLYDKLINYSKLNKKAINVYIVPYMGETSQGVARKSLKHVIVGQWTDKPSGGKAITEKFRPLEARPFKKRLFQSNGRS